MSIHEEEVLGKAYDARLMRRLLGYLRPYRRNVVLASAAIVGHSDCQPPSARSCSCGRAATMVAASIGARCAAASTPS